MSWGLTEVRTLRKHETESELENGEREKGAWMGNEEKQCAGAGTN